MGWLKEWQDAQNEILGIVIELRSVSRALHAVFSIDTPIVVGVDNAMLNLIDAQTKAGAAIKELLEEAGLSEWMEDDG